LNWDGCLDDYIARDGRPAQNGIQKNCAQVCACLDRRKSAVQRFARQRPFERAIYGTLSVADLMKIVLPLTMMILWRKGSGYSQSRERFSGLAQWLFSQSAAIGFAAFYEGPC
jgi:hypothetical protein